MSNWPPFVIFSLPRSRSAWLAAWLGAVSGEAIGHDLAVETDTVDGWLEIVFRRVRGTCETGAVEVWPILRQSIPQCRIVVVARDVAYVADSLTRAGVPVDWEMLERRARSLRDLSEQSDVLAVNFDDMRNPRVCALIQEYCLGTPFDWATWDRMDRINVQIDMPGRITRLRERAAPIARLKLELAARLEAPAPFVTIGEEPWGRVADECEALGAAHHEEATEGREGPYRLNRALVAQMDAAGLWRAFVARVDGKIIGYCLWSHADNAETDAPPTMNHGPFYVSPGHERRGLGRKLLAASVKALAQSGYRVVKLHHTMYGRGARVGRLYESMGAVEHQREYLMSIA